MDVSFCNKSCTRNQSVIQNHYPEKKPNETPNYSFSMISKVYNPFPKPTVSD